MLKNAHLMKCLQWVLNRLGGKDDLEIVLNLIFNPFDLILTPLSYLLFLVKLTFCCITNKIIDFLVALEQT